MRIPARWKLHFVLHYTSVGVPHQRSVVNWDSVFKLIPLERVRREVATILLTDSELLIPPKTPAHRVEHTWTADRNYLLYSLLPHMHLRGNRSVIRPSTRMDRRKSYSTYHSTISTGSIVTN